MIPLPNPTKMTAEDFMAWAEAQERGRFELVCGEIVAMAPEIADHARVKAEIYVALRNAIRKAKLKCEAFVDSLSVRIDDETVYEPDVLVNCGDRVPSRSLFAPTPIIVVEVISPSSRRKDTGAKLQDYFRVSSIQHYLVADLERRLFLHHTRGDNGSISTLIVKDRNILLESLNLKLDFTDVFPSDELT